MSDTVGFLLSSTRVLACLGGVAKHACMLQCVDLTSLVGGPHAYN